MEWWLRDKLQSLNYTTWFHPDVTVVLPSTDVPQNPPFVGKELIEHGDLLHVDFGVTALGLNTDTQHLAYVLPPGRSKQDIPKGFRDGLRKANQLQDIVGRMMRPGFTGNQILKYAQDEMKSQAIEGRIYSHPIGDWGHSAGTLIGMSNLQKGVSVLGDLELLKDMYYSIELYAEHFVPEMNDTFNFFLEEDVYWDRDTERFEWVYGRQEEFHLIKSRDPAMLRVQG